MMNNNKVYTINNMNNNRKCGNYSFRTTLLFICLFQLIISISIWYLGTITPQRTDSISSSLRSQVIDNIRSRVMLTIFTPYIQVRTLYSALNLTYAGQLGSIPQLSNVSGFL